jgi:AraC-like DNA-binding protein
VRSAYTSGVTIDGDLYRRLCRARTRLLDDLEDPPDLRELARVAGLSPYHLLRVFRERFGETPQACLTRRRIERAKAALRAGQSVTDACLDVGFSSVGSFSALFRRMVGVSPSEYQRTLRAVSQCPEVVAPVLVPFCFLIAFAPSSAKIAILEKPLSFRP